MRKTPALASWIAKTEQAKLDQLADVLAHEVAFYPAMTGLIETTQQGRTGPKPKTAQASLMAQVRNEFERVGVQLPQWKNGRSQRTDLADFCAQLIGISGCRAGRISSRTADNAPRLGWVVAPKLSAIADAVQILFSGKYV